ncbi:MAG: hypothetical protein WEB85_14355 [Dongiaceae bacterium]
MTEARRRGKRVAAASRPDDADPEIGALARRHAEAAVAALVAVMSDADATPAARVSAASALLNWGYGKAGPAAPEGGDAGPQVVRLVWGGGSKP